MNDALETVETLTGMANPYLGLKQGVLVTSMIVGAFFGALITFKLITNTSRRRYLLIIDMIFIAGSLLTTVVNYYVLLSARFI
jgi:predicted MFS family arabinose efflux permease